MSCSASAERVKRAARESGVSATAGKSAFVGGSSSQVSFFVTQRKIAARLARRSKESHKQAQSSQEDSARPPTATQPQIKMSDQFNEEEIQRLSLHLRLGAAAVARHIRELGSGAPRGLGHRDPRPLDWAQLDQEQHHFLIGQLTEARRGRGYLDVGGLNTEQQVELWRFARFEADRALRNIDHLATPGNPVRPVGGPAGESPTADYLSAGHKLEARFYTYLANQLEKIVPASRLHVGEIE